MPKESLDVKKTRAEKIVRILSELFPNPKTALNYSNPYELLVATVLSAQCTDARVNIVTPSLFKAAPTPWVLAELPLPKLEKLIGSINFYKNKAKNLKSLGKDLVEKHNGAVPGTRDELVALAGVGRKTANVVLTECFGVPAIVVDTHVKRLANRLGWVKSESPDDIEKKLELVVGVEHWLRLSHYLILHGRSTCKALRPLCSQCAVAKLCPTGARNIANSVNELSESQ